MAKLPKILHVIPGEAKGVSMIFAKKQVESLQKAGVNAKIFFLCSRTSPSLFVKEFQRLRREMWLFKPDIIHAHYGTVTAFCCILATRIPLVITFRGSDLNPSPAVSWLRKTTGIFLSQLSALRAKQIICVSDGLKRKLWWRKKAVTVIPSGIDTSIFYPRSRDVARSELGWDRNERVVLFNAGADPVNKRLDLAEASVEVARAICGHVRFVVLDGTVDPQIVPVLMNASDCLLCTSDMEGSPNIVKEAMACNLPVVSVDVGDVRDRLEKVKPSRIVKRNAEELGGVLAEILQIGGRSDGFETIHELSIEKIAMRIISVYQAVLSERDHKLLKDLEK